jgi:hypothetical protein
MFEVIFESPFWWARKLRREKKTEKGSCMPRKR